MLLTYVVANMDIAVQEKTIAERDVNQAPVTMILIPLFVVLHAPQSALDFVQQ
ncbi:MULTISPECIES: hypothetical protein [Brenneria]|uniref:hypothetical protein n=1 Tax=Brenneria TaxID=71655 RepID=UPI0002FFD3D3|nr:MULTISPECIES: hypothetical protein [Brenneria]